MPGRSVPLVTGEIYHIFNRGNEKREIFNKPWDYKRFLKTLYYYQFKGPKPKFSNFCDGCLQPVNLLPENKLVEILCYCLMPNHFHLMIRQLKDDGISTFISQLSNSYTKYFNIKNNRVGALFQGVFKSVLIESDEQFLQLSRYIHLNPVASGLVKNLEEYHWSSYHQYCRNLNGICSTGNILSNFSLIEKYEEFLKDQIDYGETLVLIKDQLVDIED